MVILQSPLDDSKDPPHDRSGPEFPCSVNESYWPQVLYSCNNLRLWEPYDPLKLPKLGDMLCLAHALY
jgi:hypothetical protein